MPDLPHCLQSEQPVNLRQAPRLPAPGPEEAAHAARLLDHIRQAIEAHGGALPFHRFMHLALYAPGLGYYVAGRSRFGQRGDFVTAPELGDVFARVLARPVAAALAQAGDEILEAGAGRGLLAAELLLALERLDALPARYGILEVSPDLRAVQRETLAARAPHLLPRVAWLDAPPVAVQGVILANEVLDAMPVHLFEKDEQGRLWERAVAWQDGGLAWTRTTPGPALAARLAVLDPLLPAPYQSEVNLAAEAWIRELGERLRTGVMLLFDYGFPVREYYHPQRGMGTLMCHYRHHAHGDPLMLTGVQDITAHVDFSAMAQAGRAAGLDVLGYDAQASFLVDAGLHEVLMEHVPDGPAAQLALANQVKRLTLPSEMGELFKVLALGRGVAGTLPGLRGRSRLARL